MPDHPNVVSEKDVEWSESSHGETFGYPRKSLSLATGGEKLECSLHQVLPAVCLERTEEQLAMQQYRQGNTL